MPPIRLLALLGLGGFLSATSAGAASPFSLGDRPPTVDLANPPEGVDTTAMPVAVVEAYPELRINRPVVLTGAGDQSGRIFVASQTGEIYQFAQNDEQVEQADLFGDLSDRVAYKDNENEEGFLGLAFHPEFSANGRMIVYYTTSERPHVSVLSEFRTIDPGTNTQLDPDSEKVLMTIDQPFWNHNGGTVAFGPDGYLYVALGDGGKANDPLLSAQDLSKLLGSILRINVDRAGESRPYAIPADNPYAGRKGVWPEIYASGLRNVWRMAFDPATGDLWAADVGQNLYEEINRITAGGNYGWSVREAAHDFDKSGAKIKDRSSLIDPIAEYPHTDDWGKSITGGAVYRGKRTPVLEGHYLYGDYVTGKLWALKLDDQDRVAANRPIRWSQLAVFTFGQTDDGEVLMTTMMGGGRIYKFVASDDSK